MPANSSEKAQQGHREARYAPLQCLNRSPSSAPVLLEGAMRAAREYPKIIAERMRSSAVGYWREVLRLSPNEDGTATLAVCRHEALASADEFADERGEVNLPDEIAGKTVVGVEDKWIVGGELTCCGSGWTYRQSEIGNAIGWVRLNGWEPTNSMAIEIFQAVFVSAPLVK